MWLAVIVSSIAGPPPRPVDLQGLYVQTRLLATDGSGDVADLTASGDTHMTDVNGDIMLEIHAQSPSWAQWDVVEIYANAPTFPLDPEAP